MTPTDILALQRTVGNRQVQHIVARYIDPLNGPQQSIFAKAKPGITVQTKLTVGALNDISELRPDRIAN